MFIAKRVVAPKLKSRAAKSVEEIEEPACEYDPIVWGEGYKEGAIICYGGTAYRVMQDTVASEVYNPSDDGMLAIYMVYRGDGTYEWMYGEYVEKGWERTYEGETYKCISATAVANIYPPTEAISVWEKI